MADPLRAVANPGSSGCGHRPSPSPQTTNDLCTITREVVEAARETLLIGTE
jgi:hypothetical protein